MRSNRRARRRLASPASRRPAATAPWFWSDQYDLKLQMAGLSEGYDDLAIRGSTQGSSFIAFYLRDGRVIAADAVNRPPNSWPRNA